MSKIISAGLGSVVKAMRKQGMTFRQIEDELRKNYNFRVSFQSIRTFLVSDEARGILPARSDLEKAKRLIIDFGAGWNKLITKFTEEDKALAKSFMRNWLDKANILED